MFYGGIEFVFCDEEKKKTRNAKGTIEGCEQMYFYQSSRAITIFIPAVEGDRSIPGGWEVRPVPSYYHMVFQRRELRRAYESPRTRLTVDNRAGSPA